MNKSEFIRKLSNETGYSIEECTIINDILESNFFISKQSKSVIIEYIMDKLNIGKESAENIYYTSIDILKREIKNSLKHPFKSKD